MAATDWSRFFIYASRIISLRPDGLKNISPHVFSTLDITKPSIPPLLPQLRILNWVSVGSRLLPHILLGPTVVDFSFVLLFDQTPINLPHLSSLCGRCPSLKKLNIIYDSSQAAVEAISCHVLDWQALESVGVYQLNAAAFSHLASMRTLRHLSILADNTMDPIFASDALRGQAFPALQTLSVEVNDASLLSRLLSFSAECPVIDLSLDVVRSSSIQSWIKCFQALQKHISHSTLKSLLFVEMLEGPRQADDTCTIPGTLLKSLHVFTNLTEPALYLCILWNWTTCC
jgi:hypothetical protein